jgi:RNA polymerase sigma factor (TIGR02999 family)
MPDITHILSQIETGDPTAADRLLPLVYEELRKLANAKLNQEKPGQTLQATALVHEAYLRLVGANLCDRWESKGHFFAAASEAMRRILIENARRRQSLKRGGDRERVAMSLPEIPTHRADSELIDLDEALRAFEVEHPDKAKLVELRYFAGMTIEQAAEILGISRVTAYRHWTFAKAWLFLRLGGGSEKEKDPK